MSDSLPTIATVFGVMSIGFLWAALLGLRRRQFSGVPANMLMSVLMLSLTSICALIVVGTQGYRAFTFEDLAATIITSPEGPGSFRAEFHFPDGRDTTFVLAGDELYVDAHILKWRTTGVLLGLRTGYELDRVAGRYSLLRDEQTRTRTVFSLARPKSLDLFHLRRRHSFLDPLVDAEYGSATFIAARRTARFELRVSPTGLLMREVRSIASDPA